VVSALSFSLPITMTEMDMYTIPGHRIDISIESDIDDGTDDDFSGWFCIETDDWPCPVCGTIVKFATARHLIIVWDEKDDPAMLKLAAACKRVGRNPRIVEYKEDFGPAISWYTFDQRDTWSAHWKPSGET
jgi:hypothetical protein